MRDRETEELIQLVSETNLLLERQTKLLEELLERLPPAVQAGRKSA